MRKISIDFIMGKVFSSAISRSDHWPTFARCVGSWSREKVQFRCIECYREKAENQQIEAEAIRLRSSVRPSPLEISFRRQSERSRHPTPFDWHSPVMAFSFLLESTLSRHFKSSFYKRRHSRQVIEKVFHAEEGRGNGIVPSPICPFEFTERSALLIIPVWQYFTSLLRM